VGYDYVAATNFLYKYRLSKPPNLPARADDIGDMCYEFYQILTKEILPPGSLARAQSGRVEYKARHEVVLKTPGCDQQEAVGASGASTNCAKKEEGIAARAQRLSEYACHF
jgi:hypothetical protein